jgi:hypothetical protein
LEQYNNNDMTRGKQRWLKSLSREEIEQELKLISQKKSDLTRSYRETLVGYALYAGYATATTQTND